MSNEDVIRDTHEPHVLTCKMTKAEVQDEYENLLRITQDIEDLELQRKSIMADMKSRKEKLTEMFEESRNKLRSKTIMRSIPCTLQLNFTKLTATLIREDTGEQVTERPMTSEERRMLNETPPLPGLGDDQEAEQDNGDWDIDNQYDEEGSE